MHAISPLILVVDDEPALLRLLEVWLRQEGFAVVTAASGAEALEAYRRHAAALAVVLLDVRMPGMDGRRTLAALRQIDPTVRCYLTGGDPGVLEGALAQGAAGSFPKPFRLDDLARELRQAAGSQAAARGQEAGGDRSRPTACPTADGCGSRRPRRGAPCAARRAG